MNWLRRFMMGRYGGDQLSIVLLILSFLLSMLAKLTNFPLFAIISYLPLGFCLYRMFSKDIEKRRMENYKFAIWMSPVYSWFKQVQSRVKDRNHRYYKCPNCKIRLRVPKGKGAIIITCPKCKTKFEKKT